MENGRRYAEGCKIIRWPCGVCGRGVGNSSIQCTSCQKWLHRKCSGIKGSMYKVMKTFVCRGCVIPVTGTGCTSVNIGVNANLELVDKLCWRHVYITLVIVLWRPVLSASSSSSLSSASVAALR